MPNFDRALACFAALAPQPKADASTAPASFVDFCAWIGVELEPGQRAFCRVAFDGCDPCDLRDGDRELARKIFGDVDRIPQEARSVVVVVAGARAGKSYVIGALRSLHLALTVPLDTLAPGEPAFAVIIAPDPRQREQCYRYVLGAVKSKPELKATLDGEAGKESFSLLRDGKTVIVESLPAKRGGTAGRGRSLVCAVLEECAFFLDDNYVVNDVEIYRGVNPRVLPGGQTILSSTPWAEAGLLYDEFVANHPSPKCAAPHLTEPGRPHRAIAAHAPTLLFRDVPLTRDIVAREQARDPVNASREYGAQFLSLGTAQFFDPAAIAAAAGKCQRGALSGSLQALIGAGIDLGFVRDAATCMVVEREPEGYSAVDWTEILPSVERLKPSQVIDRLAETADTYGATEVAGDQHYAETAKEQLWERSPPITFIAIPGGGQGKAEIFTTTRDILHEGRLRLPNEPRLLEQLREVKKRPLPGGGMAIEMPRKPKGGHGDLVSALVAGVWHLSRLLLPDAPEREPDDPRERDAARWERKVDEQIERERARERAGIDPLVADECLPPWLR